MSLRTGMSMREVLHLVITLEISGEVWEEKNLILAQNKFLNAFFLMHRKHFTLLWSVVFLLTYVRNVYVERINAKNLVKKEKIGLRERERERE
jgi:hypothetical protein